VWSVSCQTSPGGSWLVGVVKTAHRLPPRWDWAGAEHDLRPPASGDLPRITAMWERCSLATRMARFHAPVRDIPASYLETVLSDPSASLIAERVQAGMVAAVASLVPGGNGSAELGVLVEDAWQRRGIGCRLVARLVAAAPARKITELTASVLTQDGKVANLLRQVPGEFSMNRDGTTVNVRVRLASVHSVVAVVGLGAWSELVRTRRHGMDIDVHEFAVLDDGRRLSLHEDRGFSTSATRMSAEHAEQSVLTTVLPDDAEVTGDEHSWEWLASLIRDQGVAVTAEQLKAVPYVVEFGPRLSALLS
jgi:GNAT superfamily N-acetyltransferase